MILAPSAKHCIVNEMANNFIEHFTKNHCQIDTLNEDILNELYDMSYNAYNSFEDDVLYHEYMSTPGFVQQHLAKGA